MCQLTEKVIFSGCPIKFQIARMGAGFRKGKNDSWLIICQLEAWEKIGLSKAWKFPWFLLWNAWFRGPEISKNGNFAAANSSL